MYASLGSLPEFGYYLSVTAESLPFPHPLLSTAGPAQLRTLQPLLPSLCHLHSLSFGLSSQMGYSGPETEESQGGNGGIMRKPFGLPELFSKEPPNTFHKHAPLMWNA